MLEGLVKRTGDSKRRAERQAQLELPSFPRALGYLWRIFWRIRRRKGGNGFGAAPIEGGDVESFERRFHFALAPWEHEIVDELDDLYLIDRSKDDKPPDDGGGE